MEQSGFERISWRDNPDAVELGFDHYLSLIERRLRGENVSLVQGLREYYMQELRIDLRETQARGLMHRSSSVFIDYVNQVLGEAFVPNVEHWEGLGVEAFLEWQQRFHAARNVVAADLDQELLAAMERQSAGRAGPARRRTTAVRQILRDSALSRFLKSLYQSRCQICSFSFRLPRGGSYAECHHLRPLGQPHTGPDVQTNMVVLCPNHHAMMDYGAIAIHPDDLTVRSNERSSSDFRTPLESQRHPLDREFLEYHYTNIFRQTA